MADEKARAQLLLEGIAQAARHARSPGLVEASSKVSKITSPAPARRTSPQPLVFDTSVARQVSDVARPVANPALAADRIVLVANPAVDQNTIVLDANPDLAQNTIAFDTNPDLAQNKIVLVANPADISLHPATLVGAEMLGAETQKTIMHPWVAPTHSLVLGDVNKNVQDASVAPASAPASAPQVASLFSNSSGNANGNANGAADGPFNANANDNAKQDIQKDVFSFKTEKRASTVAALMRSAQYLCIFVLLLAVLYMGVKVMTLSRRVYDLESQSCLDRLAVQSVVQQELAATQRVEKQDARSLKPRDDSKVEQNLV